MTARQRASYTIEELTPLIAPMSVALIGASPRAGSMAARVQLSLLSGSIREQVHLVNPRYDEIDGRRCYASIADVPGPIDCAVVVVPGDAAVATLEECVRAGCRSATVLASGFAETGTAEGIALQQRVVEIAARSGMRICGPNSIGLANIRDGIESLFMPPFADRRVVGPIGLVVQSGAMAYHLLQAQVRGIGMSFGLMPGNSSDVDVIDFVNFLVDDESTKVIGLVFEGLGGVPGAGKRLEEVARRARAKRKPIVAIRGGAGEASRAAALSHTGGMTGSTRAFTAAFERMGIVEVDDLDALIETAQLFAKSGVARAPGASIVSLSGGAGVLAAGAAERRGVSLPKLQDDTAEALREFVPSYGSIGNPLDLTATVAISESDALSATIQTIAKDEQYGVIVVPQTVALDSVTTPRCGVLRDAAHAIDVPLVVVWLSEWLQGPGSEIIEADERASLFRSSGRAFAAIDSWVVWSRWLQEPSELDSVADAGAWTAAATVRALLDDALAATPGADRIVLDEVASRALLAAAGVPSSTLVTASTADDAAAAASGLGFPVVMKVLSAAITHKSRIGGVRLKLHDEHDVREAFASIRTSVAAAGYGDDDFRVLVEPMASYRDELIVGGRYDHDFDHIVLFGRGGTAVEEVDDSVVGLGPVGVDQARSMIDRLGAGVPGERVADIASAVQAVSRLFEHDPRIEEIDVNPLVTTADGVLALDGVVVAVRSRS